MTAEPASDSAAPDYWIDLAASLRGSGKAREAIAACQRALEISPGNPRALNAFAHALRMQDRFGEAVSAARAALESEPKFAAAWFNLGAALASLGETDNAIDAYRKALDLDPAFAEAWNNLAAALGTQGKMEDEVRALRRAVELAPGMAPIWSNLGDALRRAGEAEEAVAACTKAVELEARSPIAWNNLAGSLSSLDRHVEAEAASRSALKLAPNLAEAWSNLGNALRGQRRFSEAVEAYRKALAITPRQAGILNNLGLALHDSGDLQKAIDHHRQAIAITPSFAPAWSALGAALHELGQFDEALDACRKAVTSDPGSAGSWNTLGIVLLLRGQTDAAVEALERCLRINPRLAAAWRNLGSGHEANRAFDQAVSAFRRALAERPEHAEARAALVRVLMQTCAWDDLESESPLLDASLAAADRDFRSPEMPLVNVMRHADPAMNLKVAQSWAAPLERSYPPAFRFSPGRGAPANRPVRIAYLSADFHNHATAHLTLGLYRGHDREKFSVYGYSYGPDDGSDYRRKIADACDHFCDVRELDHRRAAQRIFDDGVDVLIDLKGWTGDHRLEICALRPAPVQMTYLGFPGTSGARFFDYAIVDQSVVPPEHRQYYSERLINLPHCYQINDDEQAFAGEVCRRSDFGLPQDAIVFCSFNQPTKLERVMFAAWIRILREVPGSVLWLQPDNAWAEANLKHEASAQGVAPERLVFAKLLPPASHLKRLQLADIALDTRVYNGHTTTSNALWAGVPVVTLCGGHFASRVSASCLYSTGMPELVTTTLEEFVRLAIRLATSRDELQAVKAKLLTNRVNAPLFDTTRSVRNLERAYLAALNRYELGQPADHLSIVE